MTDLGGVRRASGKTAGRIIQRPRFGQDVLSESDFMTRIQLALGLSPRQLAKALDVPLADVVDRHGPRSDASSYVTDPFWRTLSEYVDLQIAGYLSVKDELDRKARIDAREHAAHLTRVLGER
jgi:hypothetical protein